MTQLIITRGLPASGKTTWARQWVARDEQRRARVNRDDLRFALFGRYWPVDEPVVTAAQRAAVKALLRRGTSVVVDDTNLRQKDAVRWAELALEMGADFESVFIDTPLALCLERDRKRQAAGERYVGHDVIAEKHNRYLAGKTLAPVVPPEQPQFRTYVPDPSLPHAYIVDLDGTLARMKGRGPYDWTRVGEDELVGHVASLVASLYRAGHEIVIMSGRDETCRIVTEEWLVEQKVTYHDLFMREEGDKRNDAVVKEELFFEHVAPYWNVLGAIDDRDRVVRMWRAIGLMCAQVAEGDF